MTVDSAGQRAAALLTSDPPQTNAFARLLDDMHEQGIHTLKLSGIRLGDNAYGVLLAELCQRFRLRDQLRELDFSDTELPQITTLLEAIANNHHGHLLSLNLSNTHFPLSRGGPSTDKNRKIGLQPHHLSLVLDIVKANKDLRTLNLNHQDLLGSTKLRTHPRSTHRDAPIYRLMEICLASKIEVLELRDCGLSDMDLSDIAHMLSCSRLRGQTHLRELQLQDNDSRGTYNWAYFIRQLDQHPTLEHLGLPNAAFAAYVALDDANKRDLAQRMGACLRLQHLEPGDLANALHVHTALWKRSAQMRDAYFMNAVLTIRSCSPNISRDNLGQALSDIARLEGLDPAQVLPARLVHASDGDTQQKQKP